MPQYLIAIHHPDGYDGSKESPDMARDIDALNDDIVAAGARVFVGGLHPAQAAKGWRLNPSGGVDAFDGPYFEIDEHVGGFRVIEAASMDHAVEWERRAALACRAPVEVRQFYEGRA